MSLAHRWPRPDRAVRSAAPPTLLMRFGVIALVGITTLGLVLGAQLRSVIAHRAQVNAERSSLVYLQLVKEAFLPPSLGGGGLQSSLVATSEQQSQSDVLFANPVIADQVLGAIAWTVDGTIVFSTAPSIVGQREELPDSAVQAMGGEAASVIADATRVRSDSYDPAAHADEKVLVVDMPLSVFGDDQPEVIIEIATTYAGTAAAIRRDTAVVYGWLAVGLLALYLALFRLVATASRQLRAQSRTNRELAEHDALTGLANRTLLHDRTVVAIAEARRREGSIALLLLDLDRFKEINDTLGHRHGDVLLRLVGARLESVLHEDGTVARLGGDEFVVLLHDVESTEAARAVGDRLLAALDDPFPVDGLDLDVGCSLGIAVSPEHGDDFETLLQHADVAMYAAKSSQSGICVYDPEHDLNSTARLSLLGELRRGIDTGQLVLHFQPQADVETGAVVGVEALVRWEHPTHGLLSPDAFIPLAKSTSLIRKLTLAVLDEALAFVKRMRADGHDLTVAVNLSAHSLLDPDLTDDVHTALDRHGLPGEVLVLEITESSVMADRERARTTLVRLAELGVALSIDDFGTGYSSLAYLHRLPVDELKIDRTFVGDLGAASKGAIVTASIDIARALGLRVVAEGVEDQETWDRLAALGCEIAQGYHLCRPVPADVLATWMAQRRVPSA